MISGDADTTRPGLDLRLAIALRAMASGIGWPGPARQELQALGLVDGDACTAAGRAMVDDAPAYLHEALVRMAYRLRQTMRGHDDGK